MKRILIILLCFLTLQSFGQGVHTRRGISSGGGGGGTPQNLALNSETLETAGAWDIYGAWTFVSSNTGTDVLSNATMERVYASFASGSYYQTVVDNINTSTLYTIGFDAYWAEGSCATITIIIEDASDYSTMLDQNFSGSVTGSAQHFEYEFTTEGTLAAGINITFSHATDCDADIYLGRVHLYEGGIGTHTYATTTTTQVY